MKIHALADAKGRLIAILLTGGEAHDCPIAERLLRRVTPAKRMLGDKGGKAFREGLAIVAGHSLDLPRTSATVAAIIAARSEAR